MMILSRSRLAAIALAFLFALVSSACDGPWPGADNRWPKTVGFSHATLPDATGFRAQYENTDTPSYIFSYRCPDGTTHDSAFKYMKGIFKGYLVHRETEHALELRHPSGGGRGQRAAVTFVFDPKRLVMTVLLINQEDCLKYHPRLLKRMMKLHREYSAD
ncbi:MAG: hypothetical protein V3W41_07365 [Planctomycetota bacterium]